MRRKGFSLLEALIGMSILLIIIVGVMEFLTATRSLFDRLKNSESEAQAAALAINRMKIDILHSGRGLAGALELGLVKAIEADQERLTTRSAEIAGRLRQDAEEGESRLFLTAPVEMKKGGEICLFDGEKGETGRISGVEDQDILLSSPITHTYYKESAQIVSLNATTYSIDRGTGTIRRQINTSSAQPLLEGISDFACGFAAERNLVQVTFAFASGKENRYEFKVFPKNIRLHPER